MEQELEKGFFWNQQSAENAFAIAQNYLGNMCNNREDTEVNLQKVVCWYEQSASEGYSPAQVNPGLQLYMANGVEKNLTIAPDLWLKAANQGFDHGVYYYGLHQFDNQNYDEAYFRLDRAPKQGQSGASSLIINNYKRPFFCKYF